MAAEWQAIERGYHFRGINRSFHRECWPYTNQKADQTEHSIDRKILAVLQNKDIDGTFYSRSSGI
jgi:hypothetical protein